MPFGGSLIDAANQDIGAKRGDKCDDDEPSPSTPLVHVGNLLLFLSFGFKQGRVSSQLEKQVGEVDGKQDDRGATREDEETFERRVGRVGSAIFHERQQSLLDAGIRIVHFGCVVCGACQELPSVQRKIGRLTGGGQNQSNASQRHERRARLSRSRLKSRLGKVETSPIERLQPRT